MAKDPIGTSAVLAVDLPDVSDSAGFYVRTWRETEGEPEAVEEDVVRSMHKVESSAVRKEELHALHSTHRIIPRCLEIQKLAICQGLSEF